MNSWIEQKSILVIGGTGTIGNALVQTLLSYNPRVVRILSRDEHKQFEMRNRLGDHSKIRYLIGDVREYERVVRAMSGVQIVFNLAAMKHVPACEYNPFEAVKTNVIGVQNVIEAAIENNVERVILTSSDKAINPTNAYGATKLLGERVMMAAHNYRGQSSTIFASVRFGNVLGSRGSVIPLFKDQILQNGYITVTDRDMSRFMMSPSQAVALTLKAAAEAEGGETFILKMPVMRLGDLSDAFIELFKERYNWSAEVEQKIIGIRPGEKIYEELMTEDEARFAIEYEDMFTVYSPAIFDEMCKKRHMRRAAVRSYRSIDVDPLSLQQIKELLLVEKLV
jgi:UDP-N-acetylglucosamine 4,6-dehydratase